MFGERMTRSELRRYRRRGLDPRARRLVEALAAAAPLEGATTLEIGAGIGGLSLALLERGADRATTIDAAPATAVVARALAAERGVADRLEVRVGDFAEQPADDRYDAVVLDRVVCCYPDWRGLLAPAADSARRAVAMTYPRDVWYMRLFTRTLNGVMALLRREYRFYLHPAPAMHDELRRHGLEPRVAGRTNVWELLVAVRGNGSAPVPDR
ncbi:MAG TPA: class I SAM-dependent methyltransferase [Longimicrobiales bacterium]